jgi:hypothetical protein
MTHINHQLYPKSIAYNETPSSLYPQQSFDEFRGHKRTGVPHNPRILVASPPIFLPELLIELERDNVVLYPTLRQHNWACTPSFEDLCLYLTAWFDGITVQLWGARVDITAIVDKPNHNAYLLKIAYFNGLGHLQKEGVIALEWVKHPVGKYLFDLDETTEQFRYSHRWDGCWALNIHDLDMFYNDIRPDNSFLMLLLMREYMFYSHQGEPNSCPAGLYLPKYKIANVSLCCIAPPFNSPLKRMSPLRLWPTSIITGIKHSNANATTPDGAVNSTSAFMGLSPDVNPIVAAAEEAAKYYTASAMSPALPSTAAHIHSLNTWGVMPQFSVGKLLSDIDNPNIDYGLSIDQGRRGNMADVWLAEICRTSSHELSHGLGLRHCRNTCTMLDGPAPPFLRKINPNMTPDPCPRCLEKLVYAIHGEQNVILEEVEGLTMIKLPPQFHRSRKIIHRYGRLFWCLQRKPFKNSFSFETYKRYIAVVLSRYEPAVVLTSKLYTP